MSPERVLTPAERMRFMARKGKTGKRMQMPGAEVDPRVHEALFRHMMQAGEHEPIDAVGEGKPEKFRMSDKFGEHQDEEAKRRALEEEEIRRKEREETEEEMKARQQGEGAAPKSGGGGLTALLIVLGILVYVFFFM